MRKLSLLIVFLTVAALLAGIVMAAGTPKDRKVTGQILALTNDLIVIKKGKGQMEIVRNTETRITGDLKVGAKATVQYKMVATAVEANPKTK